MLLASTMDAKAQTRTIAQAGGWAAFGGTIERSQTPTCGVDARHDQTGRHFLLQYFHNIPDALEVRVVKDTWAIPADSEIPVRMQIDSNPVWTATAVGEGRHVRFNIPLRNLDRFETQFRRGINMTLQFVGGSEPVWTFTLVGTNAVMNAFTQCLNVVIGSAAPTQPVPSQPRPTRPTQPFLAAPPPVPFLATPPEAPLIEKDPLPASGR
jgi:hypothetical protein